MTRGTRRVLAVAGLALALRGAYAVATSRGQAERVGDALQYHEYAASWLDRGAYRDGAGLAAYRVPGYPAFLAAAYATVGREPGAIQALQVLLGTGACLLVLLAARPLGAPWDLAAGLAAALSLDMLAPPARLLSETLAAFLVAACAAAWGARRGGAASPREGAALGLLGGAAGLTRPELLPLAWAFPAAAPRRWGPRALAALLGAQILLAAPWALRNASILGETVATSTAGPENLYIGLPRVAAERLGRDIGWAPRDAALHAGLGELARRDAFRADLARVWARMTWGDAALAFAVAAAAEYWPFTPAYDPTLVFLLPFALLGLRPLARDERLRPVLLAWGGLVVAHALAASMESRYRQVHAPLLVLSAAAGARWAAERLGRRRLAWAAAGWGALQLLVWAAAPHARSVLLRVRDALLG